MTAAGKAAKRVVLVGPKPRAGPGHQPGGQLTAAIGLAEYATAHGYELEIIDTMVANFPPPSLPTKIRAGLGRVVSLWRTLTGDEVGVILFVASRLSFYERALLSAIARVKGVRTLFCIRDGAFPGWMRSSPVTLRLVRLLLQVPTRIVTQGNRAASALADAGVPRGKLVVVPNWLPCTATRAERPKSPPIREPLRYVFVGWLVKDKGVFELVDAYADVRSRHAVELDVVGGGTLEEPLRESVRARGLRGIRLHGWCDSRTVYDLLDRAHVFVLPSYYEGFPNALLEAMARGLPAVCSDVGAIGESIESGVNGFLVPPGDAAALSAALEKYATQPHLITSHSARMLEKLHTLHDRDTNLDRLFGTLV